MKKPEEITCRYGIKYTVELKGTDGEIYRALKHLENCCCWTCYNHNCIEPRNEIIPNCNNVCELWTNKHYCENCEKNS